MKPHADPSPKVLADVAAAVRNRQGHERPHLDEAVIRSVIEGSLVDRFIEEAQFAGMTTSRCPDGELVPHLDGLLNEHAGDGPVLLEPALAATMPEIAAARSFLTTPNEDELYSAIAGVVSAEYGVAETGSLVRFSAPDRPRGFALLPPYVVFVLREGAILPDLLDWLKMQDSTGMPSEAVLVTGPSKTADIGMKLVTGIHGPGEVHVIIVGDG
ncbi:MAG: LUD domain-containing protein [Phycisphaerales bacterium]|nr:MAG: LUD domain-containing protein [Phycisphaerales bacterium]